MTGSSTPDEALAVALEEPGGFDPTCEDPAPQPGDIWTVLHSFDPDAGRYVYLVGLAFSEFGMWALVEERTDGCFEVTALAAVGIGDDLIDPPF